MKKSDLKKIAIVIVISVVVSFFISGLIFSDPETEPMQVRFADPVSAEFMRPSDKYFNEDSINPTRLILIGEDLGNESPFGNVND